MRRLILIMALSLTLLTVQAQAAGSNTLHDRSFYSSYRDYTLVNTTREKGDLEITRFGGSLPFSAGSLSWEYSRANLDLHEKNLADTDLRLSGRDERVEIGLSLPVWNDILSLDLKNSFSHRTDKSRLYYDYLIKSSPVDCLDLTVRLARNGEILDLEGFVLDEFIPLTVNTERTISGFDGRVRIYDGVSFFSGYEDYQLREDDAAAEAQYSSGLFGAAGYRYHGLFIGRPENYFLRILVGELAGEGRFDVYSKGIRFGQIAGLQGRLRHWKIAAGFPGSGKHRSLTLERYSADVNMIGHVESWPFTEPLVDLLGLRRNFKATADAVLWRFSGQSRFDLFADLDLMTRLDILRFYPRLHWADWMPAYMVFGVTDMDHYYDEYDRIDFGCIALELSRQIGRFELGCHVSQLFPIKLKKTATDESPAGPGTAEPTESGTSNRPRDDGGRTITFRLRYIW
ncbi:MAG: hypothetical protein GY841_11065 [FCB group bacterium]|nr:hypothetical protein [FCB group bacterium]